MALPDFTPEQYEFLTVLAALGEPVSIDIVGELAPLPPKPLFDLIRKAKKMGLMRQPQTDTFALELEAHPEVHAELRRLNHPGKLTALIERLERLDLLNQLEPAAKVKLLTAAGRADDAVLIEHDLAQKSLKSGRIVEAVEQYERIIRRLDQRAGQPTADHVIVSASLDLSRLYFRTGQGLERVPSLLTQAKAAAQRLGDRRSRALIGLQLGTFYYLSDRLSVALNGLADELAEVESLGDEDILNQSAEFFGLYYYLRGMYREAVKYYDRAIQVAEGKGDRFLNWPAPAYFGYCTAVLGQFHRSIGMVDANWRRAEQRSESGPAVHFRALLGLVLLLMDKRQEASYHLHGAHRDAVNLDNILSRTLAEVGLAYLTFKHGQVQAAYDQVAECITRLAQAGISLRQYPSPLMLELLHEFDRHELSPLPGLDFHSEMEKVISGENVHLKGVAFRIRAQIAAEQGGPRQRILSDLESSVHHLERSGDPIELAKTRTESARHELSQGNFRQAQRLAMQAWEGLSGFRSSDFPDDLTHLIDRPGALNSGNKRTEDLLDRLLESVKQITPSPDLDELFLRLVEALNRFLQAERGGLFWFPRDKRRSPTLRAARNLSREEVFSKDFRSNLAMVFQSYRENRPIIHRADRTTSKPALQRTRSWVCIPFSFGGRLKGVLYHDNSYLEDCFAFLDEPLLSKLAANVGAYMERVYEYGRLREERDLLTSERRLHFDGPESEGILTDNPRMMDLLALADRAADSESTVLITGETGVGKELLARRVHLHSPRHDGPFIVVDPAGVPGGLVESELFGHEKGAFTGAERRKPGRLELAHGGTLFIDELGEIPNAIQVKLLRAIQEKSFMRVGGTKLLSSDFRLVAATNRNLEEEVAAGRFRQDLYYRLNVVPLYIPALRERGEDAVYLARYFVRQYAREFQQPDVFLSAEDETRLAGYSWPGNVRELKNVIERAVLLSDGPRLQLNLPLNTKVGPAHPFDDHPTLDEVQRRYISLVLAQTDKRISGPGGAAEILSMKRTSLYARMKKLGLR